MGLQASFAAAELSDWTQTALFFFLSPFVFFVHFVVQRPELVCLAIRANHQTKHQNAASVFLRLRALMRRKIAGSHAVHRPR